jgi:hypothetical protein
MIDDRSGIELLRESIDAIATDLDRPSARRPRRRVPRAVVLATAIGAAAGLLLVAVLLRPQPARPAVEVLSLTINGHPVEVQVIDSRRAGSIVIVPKPKRGARPLATLGGAR